MAKALLPSLPCDDLTNEDDPNCVMQVLVREIINGQNFQIQTMRAINEAMNAPATDNCEVPIQTIDCDAADSCSGGIGSGFSYEGRRMNKRAFDLFCVTNCVRTEQVALRKQHGWECGSC